MNLNKISLVTPPDKLFNLNLSYLLVKPNTNLKIQFQQLVSQTDEPTNVYIFDNTDTNIDWLLSVAQQSDVIIVDIDNCDSVTKNFIGLLLVQPNTFYTTNDESTPWKLLSKNRFYNLDWISSVTQEYNGADDSDED
jgi:hypothetical protein